MVPKLIPHVELDRNARHDLNFRHNLKLEIIIKLEINPKLVMIQKLEMIAKLDITYSRKLQYTYLISYFHNLFTLSAIKFKGVHPDFLVKFVFEIAVACKLGRVTEVLRGSWIPTAHRCPRCSHAHIWSNFWLKNHMPIFGYTHQM